MKSKALLISSDRLKEREAASEVWGILWDHADLQFNVQELPIGGLILLKRSEFSWLIAKEILEKYSKEMLFSKRIVPLERIVETRVADLEVELGNLIEIHKMLFKADLTWRICLRKRHTQLRSQEIIENLANIVSSHFPKHKVNLSNPDILCLIEVIGKSTGLSVLPRELLLSLPRERTFEHRNSNK